MQRTKESFEEYSEKAKKIIDSSRPYISNLVMKKKIYSFYGYMKETVVLCEIIDRISENIGEEEKEGGVSLDSDPILILLLGLFKITPEEKERLIAMITFIKNNESMFTDEAVQDAKEIAKEKIMALSEGKTDEELSNLPDEVLQKLREIRNE